MSNNNTRLRSGPKQREADKNKDGEKVEEPCFDEKTEDSPSLHKLIHTLRHEIKENQKEVQARLLEVEKSQAFIASQYDEINKKLDNVLMLNNKVIELEAAIKSKDIVINDMSNRLIKLEQYSRKNCIEIREVPVSPDENIEDVVIDIGNTMNIPVNTNDIEAVHRLKTAPGKVPAVIVKFNSYKMKMAFIDRKKKTVTVEGTKVYIGESMSPYYRDLFWKAKQKGKDKGFRFIWFKNMNIFLRKEERSPVIKISNEEDLNKL